MSEAKHEHVFERADVRHGNGDPMPDGRRCSCGVEVVGDGPLALNAQVVRVAAELNRALVEAIARLERDLEADRRRRFPR